MENSNMPNQQEIKIENRIFTIRGKQVMIDRDLAELYEVITKRINQQVKRNYERFPPHFCFQLTIEEINELVANCDRFKKLKHSTSFPYAFTEQGVAMLAALLRSNIAIKISIQIMDAFVQIRKQKSVQQLIDFNKKSNSLNQLSSPLIPMSFS